MKKRYIVPVIDVVMYKIEKGYEASSVQVDALILGEPDMEAFDVNSNYADDNNNSFWE